MGLYRKRMWACPYFRYDEKACVTCEGGSKIRMPDIDSYIDYIERYCTSVNGWQKCSVAKNITDYYYAQEK